MLNTGCRSGELLTLEWKNVDIDRKYFVVRNSLSKNKKTVYKPINDQALLVFDELPVKHSQWVFYNPKTQNRYKTFRRAWLWSLEKSGLDCRIHDLRHTFASLLVSNGVPIYHVSQLLGHSDTKTTQKYAHLSLIICLVSLISCLISRLPDYLVCFALVAPPMERLIFLALTPVFDGSLARLEKRNSVNS